MPHGVETHSLIADCLGFVEPAHGESFPMGQRRGPVAPETDGAPSPDHASLRTSTTPTARGRKKLSPRLIPPRTVWKPHPHRLIADWLRLIKPARLESCPSGQRRGPTTPGDDETSSLDRNPSKTPRTKTVTSRVDTAPHGVKSSPPSADP